MKQKKTIDTIVMGTLGILGIIVFYLCYGKFEGMFQAEDFEAFTKWWKMLFLLGIGFYPLAAFLFQKFSDHGYFFSKVFGIIFGGWLVWVLSALHIVKFTTTGCLVLLILCSIACYVGTFFYCRKKKQKYLEFLGLTDGSNLVTRAIWYETLFFALFGLLVYLKCFHPQAYGEEKFMDYGFMISMMKSDYMPPEDFWFSGTNLNYYYLTQFFATFLTKLARVTVNHGYNLSLMMTASFCFVLVYALVSRIFETYLKERAEAFKKKGKRTIAQYPFAVETYCRIAGTLSALGVTFASSCHYFVYAKLVPIFREMLKIEGDISYWFPDATRYIGHQRENTGDKTIHEFPSYSFIQGDLHAHVVNISFVLTLLAILFAWLLWRQDAMKKAVAGQTQKEDIKSLLKRELLQPHIIALSFFIGVFHMTNYWDYPIYFVVCGAVILVSNAVICRFDRRTFLLTALHGAEFLVIAFITSFMFTLKFEIMAKGIGICDKHSELYQMIVVWALPLIAVFAYLYCLIKEDCARRAEGLTEMDRKNPFFSWLENLKLSELFLLILGLCAAGLVLIPELIYVVDIYSGDYKRANTMFKLTYQAFIMFGIVMGALMTRFILFAQTARQRIGGFVMMFLLFVNLGYFKTASASWFGEYKNPENYKTLNAAAFLHDALPVDARMIDWINENIEGRPTILEAPGDSYTDYDRVSAFTGCPTVVGWHTHEWLWKDDVAAVDARGEDVKTIYTSEDRDTVMALIEKYDIDYIYVGHLEYDKYREDGELDYDFIRSLGEVVHEETDGVYYKTFLVKVNR